MNIGVIAFFTFVGAILNAITGLNSMKVDGCILDMSVRNFYLRKHMATFTKNRMLLMKPGSDSGSKESAVLG